MRGTRALRFICEFTFAHICDKMIVDKRIMYVVSSNYLKPIVDELWSAVTLLPFCTGIEASSTTFYHSRPSRQEVRIEGCALMQISQ